MKRPNPSLPAERLDLPKHTRRMVAFGMGAALVPTWATAAAPPDGAFPGAAIRVGGTGAGVDALAQVFAGDTGDRLALTVVPSLGSTGGIKALLAGVLDAALIARALKPEEEARGLRAVEVFRSPLVWAVSPRTPAGALKSRDLIAIYDGQFKVWSDGVAVRPVLRPEGDTDHDAVQAWHPELCRVMTQALRRPGMRVALTDGEAVENIEQIAGAIGSATLGLVLQRRGGLRALEIDGVAPSVQALAAGRWRPHKLFRVVTTAQARGEGASAGSRLLQQIVSPAVQSRLTKLGYLPERSV
jgi:phosphate transport system substrate-binding protein